MTITVSRDMVARFEGSTERLIDGIIRGMDTILDQVDDEEDTITLSDNQRGIHWTCHRHTGIVLEEGS